MKYEKISMAVFIDRPNRFIANVETDGKILSVHVKNTGRCRELLLSGAAVILSESGNPGRKTKYDLIAVKKEGLGWVNIDSQAPNVIVKEWLEAKPEIFGDVTYVKPEYKYGNSRVDFYMKGKDRRILLEVKGCTLEINGVGYFPDAPTLRGVKHLNELAKAASEGFDCYVAFVIQMMNVNKVLPNDVTHPEFGEALRNAERCGVKVLYLPCSVSPDEIKIV